MKLNTINFTSIGSNKGPPKIERARAHARLVCSSIG